MNNFKNYLEYEKQVSAPKEGDFLESLLSLDAKIDFYKKSSSNTNVAIENKNKIKTEYLGWAFGFVGFSMAAFMFFISPTQTQNVATISSQEIETLREKSKRAVEVIDSIESFDVERSNVDEI